MADIRTHDVAEPMSREAWFRGHVMTRFFATVWWLVMVLTTVGVAANWIALVVDPRIGRLVGAGIALVIAIPIVREWPDGRRMWRMLRHGT